MLALVSLSAASTSIYLETSRVCMRYSTLGRSSIHTHELRISGPFCLEVGHQRNSGPGRLNDSQLMRSGKLFMRWLLAQPLGPILSRRSGPSLRPSEPSLCPDLAHPASVWAQVSTLAHPSPAWTNPGKARATWAQRCAATARACNVWLCCTGVLRRTRGPRTCAGCDGPQQQAVGTPRD